MKGIVFWNRNSNKGLDKITESRLLKLSKKIEVIHPLFCLSAGRNSSKKGYGGDFVCNVSNFTVWRDFSLCSYKGGWKESSGDGDRVLSATLVSGHERSTNMTSHSLGMALRCDPRTMSRSKSIFILMRAPVSDSSEGTLLQLCVSG